MLTRFLIWAIFILVIFRTIGRLMRSISEGMSGRPAPGGGGPGRSSNAPAPARGETMVRDPVCGTYVVPSRAVSAKGKDGTVYFCSDTCRQSYLKG
jgi:YHS domain-containing protein